MSYLSVMLVWLALGFVACGTPVQPAVTEASGVGGGIKAGAVPRVGFLSQGTQGRTSDLPAFQRGLADWGYVEGRNIEIVLRFADGELSRLPSLAQELVEQRVAVIVATSSPAIQAAKDVTSTVPIVMGISSDPVQQGFVASLARPGGNVTGLTSISLELSGKRVEKLQELVPGMTRVAILWDPGNPAKAQELHATQEVAALFKLEAISLEARRVEEFEQAFDLAVQRGASGLIVLGGPLFQQNHARLVELATTHRLPVIYETPSLAEQGGLAAYGPITGDLFQRSAYFVHRILEGTKPADLPVERPTRFYLYVNLPAAEAIGLTIPVAMRQDIDQLVAQ